MKKIISLIMTFILLPLSIYLFLLIFFFATDFLFGDGAIVYHYSYLGKRNLLRTLGNDWLQSIPLLYVCFFLYMLLFLIMKDRLKNEAVRILLPAIIAGLCLSVVLIRGFSPLYSLIFSISLAAWSVLFGFLFSKNHLYWNK
jgi:hypothetical protein